MFNPSNPNPFTMSVMQRQQDIDNAVRYFVDLYYENVDINDASIQKQVFKHYDLTDLSKAEQAEIVRRVEKALA